MKDRIGSITLVALTAWFLYAIFGTHEQRTLDEPGVSYRPQPDSRSHRGEFHRPEEQGNLSGDPVRYNEKVRRLTSRALMTRTVIASWYGGSDGFVGKCKANGELFDDGRFTVAHRELPLGTLIALEHEGRFILATVTDRGPYIKGRDLDVSRAIARHLGVGVTPVTMYVLRVPKQNVTFHRDNPRCLKV